MPLYTVTTQAGVLSNEAKATLPGEVLSPGACRGPEELGPHRFSRISGGKRLHRRGSRSASGAHAPNPHGRSPEYKQELLKRLWELLQDATGAPNDQLVLGIQEVPPSQAMEMDNHWTDVDPPLSAMPKF